MDSLTIQDGFAPYYAGRKPFFVPDDGKADAKAPRPIGKASSSRLPRAPRSPDSEGETEH